MMRIPDDRSKKLKKWADGVPASRGGGAYIVRKSTTTKLKSSKVMGVAASVPYSRSVGYDGDRI